MAQANTPADYFAELFSGDGPADPACNPVAEAARVARVKAGETARRLRPACGRCHGAGRIGAFAHVSGGVCFECGGSGFKA